MPYSAYRPVRHHTKPPVDMTPIRSAIAILLCCVCAFIPIGFAKQAWDKSEVSRVCQAALNGNLGGLKATLKATPQLVNAQGYLGRTPLYWAATGNQEAIMRYLVQEKKADLNKADARGWTPVFAAVTNNRKEALQDLIDLRATLNGVDTQGWTVLHAAASGANPDTAEVLFDAGLDVNAVDKGGRTPLHIAAMNHQMIMTKLLIEHGANVNSKAKDGSTPLRLARAETHNDEIIQLLLDAGGDE